MNFPLRRVYADLTEWIFATRLWNKFGKNSREAGYWKSNLDKMVKWYEGKEEWRYPFPKEEQKERRFNLLKNAVITYINVETEQASYLHDMKLASDSFVERRVADVGSGAPANLTRVRKLRKILPRSFDGRLSPNGASARSLRC